MNNILIIKIKPIFKGEFQEEASLLILSLYISILYHVIIHYMLPTPLHTDENVKPHIKQKVRPGH